MPDSTRSRPTTGDHSADDTALYLDLAGKYGLLVTGGSDFHGDAKPGVRLGIGCGGNLKIPDGLVQKLRSAQQSRSGGALQ